MLQAGSAAAALGSILGLAFTLGDRVTGLFGDDGPPLVRIDSVELETMPLRTYLMTKKAQDNPSGYPPEDLDSDVLVVTVNARYDNSSRGVPFPARLTLEARDPVRGQVAVGAPLSADYVLDDSKDQCGCYDFFYLPPRGREYRVVVQILRPNTPDAVPLDDKESDWYRL